MDDTLKSKILELLDQHRPMTVATNRPDGWPQATTVGYVNERRPDDRFPVQPTKPESGQPRADNRISLTIDHDVSDPVAITGLSVAAQGTASHRRKTHGWARTATTCSRSLCPGPSFLCISATGEIEIIKNCESWNFASAPWLPFSKPRGRPYEIKTQQANNNCGGGG